MKDDVTEFQSLLRALAKEELAPVGEHFTPDHLAAYHFRQLSAEEEEATQDHLVTCRACTMLLLDLAELCAEEPEETTSAEPSSVAPAPPLEAPPRTAPSFFQQLRDQLFPFRLVPALAALSLLLALSLGFWALSLRREKQTLLAQLTEQQTAREAEIAQEIAALQQQKNEAQLRANQLATEAEQVRKERDELLKPQLNAPIVDLELSPSRGTSEPRKETSPGTLLLTARFTLVIPASVPEPKHPDYAIEIFNQRGEAVVKETGLRLPPVGGFTIDLPRQSFPAGEYRVQVYGLGRGARVRVAEGVFRIRYQ